MTIEYLTTTEVLALHRILIDTYGGASGFRIVCRQRETYVYLMKLLATNSFRFEQLRTWLESVVVKLP
jgi:hypothetical protein